MRMLRMAVLMGLMSMVLHTPEALAASRSGKINTKKLVDEYWTPSRKKYSLIQKRYFVKALRPMISLTGGVHVNNPEHEGFFGQAGAGFFFSEKVGIEFQYANSSLKGNDVIDRLDGLSGGSSTLDRTKTLSYIGGALNYSPIYAKMSFLGYKILYYDLILSAQAGLTTYEQTLATNSSEETAMTVGFGITQMFYLNRHLSLKVDFTNRWYEAEVLKYTNGSKVKDRIVNDTLLSVGFAIML